MQPLLVLNVVGLTPRLLDSGHMPYLNAFSQAGKAATLHTITPAVTCSVQSTLLTGVLPKEHGIVANGWFFKDQQEIRFWHQSNHLVNGEKVWECGRRIDPRFTSANMFWWFNMYSSVDYSVTPRPIYCADGRKIPDCYTHPPTLRDTLTKQLGRFPLFQFWGPGTDIHSSRWIAHSTSHVMKTANPTLTLCYLPHLDYNLQRFGADSLSAIAGDLKEIDIVCGKLIDQAQQEQRQVLVLSEYGINSVNQPVHINRALRQAGWLSVRVEQNTDLLDPGASSAFAVTDHQVAHIYINDKTILPEVKSCLSQLNGVESVLDGKGKQLYGLDHPRSGDLVVIAKSNSWFTYYHWLDDNRAPDYARTVDIHRKPGYDPVELFLAPALTMPKVTIATKLIRKKLGFRTLMDVIPLDASLVKGSHGRVSDDPEISPMIISSNVNAINTKTVSATDVKEIILKIIFDDINY